MRFRVLAAAAFVAAALVPQTPASAWRCYQSSAVGVCFIFEAEPFCDPTQQLCWQSHMDVCVYAVYVGEIVCAPVVWPPA